MLRKPPVDKPREEETAFETTCRLAREMDIKGLRERKEVDPFIFYTSQDGCTPVKLLAMEGNEKAVEMLITEFNASRADAIAGYAEAGLVKNVNHLTIIQPPIDLSSFHSFLANVGKAMYSYHGLNHAIEGYVRGGLDEQVEDLLNQHAELLDKAVNEYVKKSAWDKVEDLLARGGSMNVENIAEQVFQDQHLCFRLMSMVDNEETRRRILIKSNPWIADDEFEFIHQLKKAGRMNRIMREYNLSFHQALPLHEFQENSQLPGVRTWLLEGLQIAEQRKENMPAKANEAPVTVLPLLSRDIFLKISSMLVGLPIEDTRKILVGVHAQLFASVAKENAKKFALGLFTPAKYMSEQIKDMDGYEQTKKRIA